MIYNTLLAVLAVSAGLLDIALGESHGRIWGRSNLSPRQNNETPSTCLAEQAIQTASFSDGQGQNDKGVKAGQAKSETSVAPCTPFGKPFNIGTGVKITLLMLAMDKR